MSINRKRVRRLMRKMGLLVKNSRSTMSSRRMTRCCVGKGTRTPAAVSVSASVTLTIDRHDAQRRE
jgi:hypothetical protein